MPFIFITAPSKTMDESSSWRGIVQKTSQPRNEKQTQELIKHLASKTKKELSSILHTNQDLTELNYQRYQNLSQKKVVTTPALLLYAGQIFAQMNPAAYDLKQQQYCQLSMRILSGLYGIVRPYDLISPYRLEMKTTLQIPKKIKVSQYWKKSVTEALNQDIDKYKISALIDLASKEYSSSIEIAALSVPVVTIDFKEEQKEKLKTVAIYAKKARGAMMEFLIKNQVKEVSDIKNFAELGYTFESQNKNRIVFVRSEI